LTTWFSKGNVFPLATIWVGDEAEFDSDVKGHDAISAADALEELAGGKHLEEVAARISALVRDGSVEGEAPRIDK